MSVGWSSVEIFPRRQDEGGRESPTRLTSNFRSPQTSSTKLDCPFPPPGCERASHCGNNNFLTTSSVSCRPIGSTTFAGLLGLQADRRNMLMARTLWILKKSLGQISTYAERQDRQPKSDTTTALETHSRLLQHNQSACHPR